MILGIVLIKIHYIYSNNLEKPDDYVVYLSWGESSFSAITLAFAVDSINVLWMSPDNYDLQ